MVGNKKKHRAQSWRFHTQSWGALPFSGEKEALFNWPGDRTLLSWEWKGVFKAASANPVDL